MKKIYTYLQLGLWVIIAMAIPHLGFAQTCDVTPMNISKIATDWTTNCARVATDACDPTNGPLCDGTQSSNWLLLNPNDYCLPKAPCNAVGFSKVEVTMTMEGTWKVKNIGNLSQNTSVGLLGCIKAWMCDLLFDPLEPSAFTGIITLAAGEEKSGNLPTRTKTSQYPGDLDALFAKNCSEKVCIDGLADGFTTLTISNGNLQAVTTVFASLKACVNYKKFDWSVTGSEAACETSSDGKVFVNFTPATGTSASDYQIRVGNGGTWTVAQTAVSGANTISGLPSGSYTVAVVYKPLANTVVPSDSESCGYCKSSVTVASATATLACTSTPDCPGGAGDGTVGVTVTGNNLGTLKYLWSTGANTSAITGLTPGNYTVTVTYGPNGKCSKITTCTVVAAPGVDADVTFTNVKCKGDADGTITVAPTSGTANYTIVVTGKNPQTTSGGSKTFTGFGPGTYTVTVTDKNGCVYTEMVTITEPPAITGSITPTSAACTGATNGSATVSASGGTGSYTYNWSRGTVAMGGTQVTGLAPGSISVTVTDANNCKKVLTSTIGTVSEVSIMCTPTPEKCVDDNNGSVSVEVSNALPDYVASWVSGPTQFSQVSSATSPVVVNNLEPGNYTIRITDKNGCYAECSFSIAEGLDLPCNITGATSICQGEIQNAHSVESVTGATYSWTLEGNTAGATIPGITTNSTVTVSIPSNATGSYTVRMTISKNGCTESCTKTVTIKELVICTINGPASVCEGSTATFTTTGVTGRTWSVTGGLSFTGQGTSSITVTIPNGTVLTNFTVSLSGTATNSCPTNCSTTTTINQKPEVTIEPTRPVCNLGTPQGAIQATATGAAPFVYRLYKHNPSRTLISTSASTPNTTYNFPNLGPGTYDVEVTDANNCTSDPSATVILVIPVGFEPELDCDSRNAVNINIKLNITNGTGPFTYSLDNNTFSAVPVNGIITIPFVDGSNQTIYLKDANDCPAISETILLQCCKLEGVCKLTKPAQLTGCDYSVVPAAKTNPADVFSNIAFCEEAKIKVTTTDGGSLCGDGLTRTYTYILYDDLNDNDKFDEDDEPFIEGTCAETYVVKPSALSCNAPTDFEIKETCTTQNIANLFSTWKNSFTYTGGCSPMVRYLVSINDGVEAEYLSIANITAPTYCGGKVKIKILVKDACTAEKMCMSTFTVPTRPDLVAAGPESVTKETCASTSDFASWKAAFKYTSGGCNYKIKYEVSINGAALTTVANLNDVLAPSSCGGSVRIKMTVTDDCDQTVVKDATYTVPTRPTLVAAGPESVTKETCASTSDFASWKAAFKYTSGGCDYKIKYEVSINGAALTTVANLNDVLAPSSCGGSVRIKMTVTDYCDQTVVKDATYTVPTRPTLVAAGPESVTKETCASTSDFASWKAAFKYTSGGCDYKIKYEVSINGAALTTVANLNDVLAPSSCGGSVRIKMTVTDDCDQTVVKDATYTVPTRPTLVAAGPESVTKETCASTSDFASWKAAFKYTSGGCDYKIKYEVSINGGNLTTVTNLNDVLAPSSCGGSVRIKMTVTDDCDQTVVKDATYTVPTRPTLVAAGPESVTKETCASTSDFASWKAAFKYTSGGCDYKIKYEVSINGAALTTVANLNDVLAPSSCGGSVRIKMTVTDDCDQTVVKDATYTVPTRPTLVAAGPESVTKETCASTSDFASWKAAFKYTSGGCDYKIKYEVSINGGNLTTVANLNDVLAPSSCGGSVRIKMTVTDDCDQTVVKDATYTVPTRPTLVAAGPDNVTKEACASTSDFASWKAAFKYTSGGCNYKIKYEVSINGGNLTTVTNLNDVAAPSSCGGTVRIKMTVTDDCDQTVVKDATYTVLTRPDLVINLPADKTVRCLLQGGIDTEFAAWIAQFNTSGGCSAAVKYYVNDKEVANLDNVKAPSECGGKVTIKIVMSDVCDQTLTKSAYFKAIPKPVGLPIEKNIYSCIAVNVDLQLQVKCDVQSTFKWYSVASVGSSVPYNHPQVDGETFNPAGTGGIITDLLTNLTTTTQTIIYRVVPTSTEDCEGDPFYVTVNIRQKADIQCLACLTEVRVTLDKNCRLLITPDLVIDGFEQCPNRELLRDALEVLIEDGNNDNYVDCAGTHKYLVRLKPEYEVCFDYAPCWGTIIAEDKTGPILECANFIKEPLDCYDVNYVLNNRLTIGNVGTTSSPRPSASSSQVINNAEGIADDDSACSLKPASLVSDNIKNLGYPFFRDNCRDCGCRTTLKWSDRVEYYSCEQMEKNGGIYARIFRQWVATDCNGMIADTVQVIDFKRPKISEFTFKDENPEGKYDHVVEYNSCAPDKSLIKKENVTPFICSYFNTLDNPRCLYLDQVECNYSVQIKDTEFPICGGKGLKIDREMYIFDWCAGGIVDTLHILIKIGDFEAPTYDYAHGAPFDISTGPMDCTAAIPVTVAGIKSAFGVTIKDNCALGNVSVSVYTKDRYVKGILVYEGPEYPFCQPQPGARKAELRGDHEDFGYCNKEEICWEKVEYAVMNGMMVGLPVGKHLMVIDAFDGCYNASTACFVFEVEDKIAPVMKCDDDLHVTLSNANGYTNGYAQVSAADIDEGSWDNCKLAWIAVRRNVPDGCAASFIAKGYDTNGNGKLDALPADGDVTKADGFDLNGDGDIADFGETFILKGGKLMTPLLDYVEFFCCDLSERVTVELWGGDIHGNTNYCWMDLLIEDKVAPTCLAPWDVTIYCDDKNIAQIDDKFASAKIFGDVTIPSGNDCAALDTTYTTEKKLKCGYGYIDRIWTLTKQTVKGPISVTCKQRIHILPVHEYNICFPKDVSTDCKTPVIDTVITDELGCDILAVNVHDKRYDASDDECYKIFRTYSVINWCTYDDRCGDPLLQTNISIIDRAVFGNYGKAPIYVLVRDREDNRRDGIEEFYISKDLIHNNADDIRFKPAYCEVAGEFYHSFIYTQIIKVYDDTRPVVTGTRDTFCTSPTACTANITKVVTIKDNCTDKVELERQQLMIAPFQTLDAGKMITYSTPRWSTKDLGNGQYEITVSNLPEGTHDLIVVGRDECGNLSVPTRIPFVVKDCKAPAPICINGLSVDLMPDGNGGGMMTVWATDFVASKIYDCNGQGPETKDGLKLITKYSVNRVKEPVNPNQTSISVNCADLELGFILVELHAWDEAGNHDFCVTFVEVQDNRKVCPDPSNVVTGEISGLVATDEAEPVLGVKIDVSGGAQMNQNTASNGLFNFGKLPLGSDFTLAAQLDKDHLNGVSTFDLVQLQKHILGVQTINNPYRLIAADVNNSKSISTLDMIQMRKLILNIDERFSNVSSWRFVDAAYKFPDPSNPWLEAFPEVINVNDLVGKVQANFIAIKMGDVNGNAQVSSTASADVRSGKALQLYTEEQELKAGQGYAVAIRAKDLASVQGFQFTLLVDPAMAQLENIEYNGVMKADHFGYFPRSGQITSSYVGAPLAGAPLSSTTAESVLFTLHLKAEANLPLSKVLKINSQLTPKEAYDKDDELMDVQLELKGTTLSDLADLHQNTPNPFVEETAIGFYLPKATATTLTVRDVKGALLYRLEGNYAKGENQVILKHEQLRSSGVLYYTLETADFTATKKMILLNK